MQQAQDFLDESEALHALLAPLDDAAFEQATLFKRWTINQIIRHLHFWNISADLALNDEPAFDILFEQVMGGLKAGRLLEFEERYLQGLSGPILLRAWIEQARAMTPAYAGADPKARIKWVGPNMSALSGITARLMETWAHGQAIYDLLGQARDDGDRIGNIVRLGVNTFGWTYKNRKMDVPQEMPHIRLTAPSGAIWEYGEPGESERIEGSATEFCQVVSQCRNVGDTSLRMTGKIANEWMAMAQCFAGPPNDPPEVGVRHRQA